MEYGADDHMMEESHTEMTIKRGYKVEESEPSTAYVGFEIDINYLKQEPGLVQVVKSEPAFLVKEEILEDSRQGTDEQQSVPTPSPLAIVGRTSVAADSVEKGALLHIKEQLEDTDLDIGPTVFQHMDSHYKTNQTQLTGIQQPNTSLNLNPVVVLSRIDDHQVKDEIIESNGKASEDSNYRCYKRKKTFQSKKIFTEHCKNMHWMEQYKCAECNREYQCSRYLQYHIKNVHSKEQFECYICKKIIKTKKSLRVHILTVHSHSFSDSSSQHIPGSEQRKHQHYSCDKCLKVFKSKIYRNKHIKHVHGTESHKCIQCNKEFKCKTYLHNHVRFAHGEKHHECDICKKIYKSGAALLKHVSSFHRNRLTDSSSPHVHGSEAVTIADSSSRHVPGSEERKHQHYSCDKCLKVFKSKLYRNTHIKYIHGTESHKCIQCNKEFKCKSYLQSHVKHAHGEKYHECDICKKIYKSVAALRNHVSSFHRNQLTDPKDSKYRCGKCMKLFQFKGQLKRHCEDIHGTERHKCSECNKEYKCLRYLQMHIKNVHGSHIHNYTCDHCQKIFWRKKGLRYHMESVHGKRIHRCRKCNQTFKCRNLLRLHKKSIHGKPTHECEVCHKLFTTTYILRVHVKKTHRLDDIQSKSDLPSQEVYDPCPIAGNTSAVVDTGTQQHNVGAVKSEPAYVEMELSPVVFQHMDSNYRPHKEELQKF